MQNELTSYAFRLVPGNDLRLSIEQFVKEKDIKAGWVAACAGSLTVYNIRFANQGLGTRAAGHYEIVTLAGTVSVNGCHLHICISDETGYTIGRHLLEGCIIYTTAEVVILSAGDLVFTRENDEQTGWKELVVTEGQ